MCEIKFIVDNRSKKEYKPVIIRVNHGGKTFKKGSGVKCRIEDWDDNTGFPIDKTSDEFVSLATLERL